MRVIGYNENVVEISRLESIKLLCLSLMWGIWMLWKTAVLTIFRSNNFEWNNIDNPPACLVDSALGQHSYIKLKVSSTFLDQ